MTGTTRSSAGLSERRRKALYRAWHRGMRETDLLLGSFADSEIATLDDADLDRFEALLNQSDSDILNWITGKAATPVEFDTAMFQRLREFSPARTGDAAHGD